MRNHRPPSSIHFHVFFMLLASSLTAQDAVQPKVKPLKSSITAVTVYADRARVTRETKLALPAETTRFSFTKLP
ncbi:MAG: hypothetical protein OSA95_09960, partial [Opitutales bacterium]|nr:hypothetical protein [Opitutales bacterium]